MFLACCFMDSEIAVRQLKEIKKLVRGDETRLAAEWADKWKVSISTILSAQTRDEVTIPVCEKLFEKYPSMIKLSKARVGSVEKIIRRINYHKTKARNIIATAKMVGGKRIPTSVDELLEFPGVGRKVANVYLAEAEAADTIGVDTHVARISFKLGWSESKNPHVIEKDLGKLFPKKYWGQINDALVRFGKSYGRSRRKEDEILAKLIN